MNLKQIKQGLQANGLWDKVKGPKADIDAVTKDEMIVLLKAKDLDWLWGAPPNDLLFMRAGQQVDDPHKGPPTRDELAIIFPGFYGTKASAGAGGAGSGSGSGAGGTGSPLPKKVNYTLGGLIALAVILLLGFVWAMFWMRPGLKEEAKKATTEAAAKVTEAEAKIKAAEDAKKVSDEAKTKAEEKATKAEEAKTKAEAKTTEAEAGKAAEAKKAEGKASDETSVRAENIPSKMLEMDSATVEYDFHLRGFKPGTGSTDSTGGGTSSSGTHTGPTSGRSLWDSLDPETQEEARKYGILPESFKPADIRTVSLAKKVREMEGKAEASFKEAKVAQAAKAKAEKAQAEADAERLKLQTSLETLKKSLDGAKAEEAKAKRDYDSLKAKVEADSRATLEAELKKAQEYATHQEERVKALEGQLVELLKKLEELSKYKDHPAPSPGTPPYPGAKK